MERVVIVGAGPVGVAAAILLAQRGVASLVLDRYPEPYPLPRAVHLDDEVMRILHVLGVADEFLTVSRPGLGLRLLDARHRVMATFDRDPTRGPHAYPQANMFDQPDLERLLRLRMADYPLISFVEGTVVAVDFPTVRYSSPDGTVRSVEASAVLGCDGANSTVRDLIGASLVDLGFEERWLVVDGICDGDLGTWGGVHQVCDPRRAATFMELGPRRYRWEFRLLPGETDLDLDPLLAPWLGTVPVRIVRRAEYTFRACVASTWQSGRVFLLGDAAHQTPPFIGQGLGAGLRDAYNLAWKLAAGDAALLATYERERRPHVRAQIRLAIVAGWAMTGGQDRAAAVRRLLLGSVWRLPGMKGLALRSTSPALRGVGRGRLAGTFAPQPSREFDDVLGDGWAVLYAGTEPSDFPDHYRLVNVTDEVDPRGSLRRWMRGRQIVLRPDRVVFATRRSQ
ncbi:bifunctional 3-(3-hydroxy-phenyl)propionate/3-hydroxycinnamic acid hydroxylase [Dactylosporangium sp. CS-033363]|uniref:bifunctional 3-(3-hydroxy-phenyl)propionate/3-hydroxycinnamic acid hydroxylase n=1 Tax=Dactylosporangium sp. CS-033363 TaxID=3239935 RepID=UPI003D8D4567